MTLDELVKILRAYSLANGWESLTNMLDGKLMPREYLNHASLGLFIDLEKTEAQAKLMLQHRPDSESIHSLREHIIWTRLRYEAINKMIAELTGEKQ